MAGSREAAAAAVQNKKVVLRRHVTGFPTEDDMEITVGTTELLVPAGLTAVLIKNLYLSCDPWMRGRMSKHEDGDSGPASDFVIGEAMVNFGVGKVIDSTHPEFIAGDLVCGMSGWEEYTLVTQPEYLHKINHTELPLSYYTGVLGMRGLTAYAGFTQVGRPKKGDFVFVSAASGAVGQVVGQLAKIAGCYVVGSAGSDEKVSLLKTKFGYDNAFNYKSETDLGAALKRCLPEGIDIYCDNVGGATLDAALLHMRHGGRVAVCGMISQYNLEERYGLRNLFCIVPKSIRVEGFNVGRYFHLYGKFEEEMAGYIKDGKVAVVQDVVEGTRSSNFTPNDCICSQHNLRRPLPIRRLRVQAKHSESSSCRTPLLRGDRQNRRRRRRLRRCSAPSRCRPRRAPRRAAVRRPVAILVERRVTQQCAVPLPSSSSPMQSAVPLPSLPSAAPSPSSLPAWSVSTSPTFCTSSARQSSTKWLLS